MPEPEPGPRTILERLGPRGISAIVLGIIVIIFIVENTRKTKIRFIGPQVSAPLWLALVIAAALGFAAGFLIDRRRRRR
ncbi:MAG TPA: DUF1049 domain-containing protein [Mycobacteriales bacterium]|jgi:uncharacterized integral membrane protein|nr:DUF1049 domain-containing protein [Mycobacteriales bacterium]